MAKNSTSGANKEFELVAPIKILVKPGFSGVGTERRASSLRRRSIPQYEVSTGSHRPNEVGDGGESGNVFMISGSGSNQVKGLRKEASVEIEENGVVKNAAYYMEHCFRLMYLTGMSTYNPDKKNNDEKIWTDIILDGVQKIVYWAVTLMSIAYAVIFLKIKWIWFVNDEGIPTFVKLASWLFTIVSEIYYVILFAFGHKRINKTIMALREIGKDSIDEVGTKKWKSRNPRKMITVLFIVSIIACFLEPMSGYGVTGWSPKKLILDSSTKFAFKLFIWSAADTSGNATKIYSLVQEYGTELTPVTVVMGITDIVMRYCSKLKMDTVLNMGIVVAVLIFLRNSYFARKVKNADFKNLEASDTEELDSPSGLFTEYKQLMKKENKLLNGLVGGLLKIIHAYSVMQGATLFMRCLDKDATLTEFAFLLYNWIKVTFMYYFGKKAEAENEVYVQWITDWAIYSKDPIFLAKTPAIIHEMTKEPMGLGRGKFLVGQGFIFRFLGFVGSIFMLEVDDDED